MVDATPPHNIEPRDDGFQPLPHNAPRLEERPAVTATQASATSRKYGGYSRTKALGVVLALSAAVTILMILARDPTPLRILETFLANVFASIVD